MSDFLIFDFKRQYKKGVVQFKVTWLASPEGAEYYSPGQRRG